MNKIYRIIWNRVLNVFQVCSELVSGKRLVTSVTRTIPASTLSQSKLIPHPSRIKRLSLTVLLALPGIASADLTVNTSLLITQDNSIIDAGTVYVGSITGGTGILNISDGGTVTGSAAVLGQSAGSSGTVDVSDGGQWNVGSVLYAGGGWYG
ncbi:ESPR-type extended signal peptide-containing protein [Citrobacter rodentium]|jgi:hypothetical protein|uniref:ESPR-type extended signal peptide-containing protein n=1 Tax=Citrobacter rodentium TaxID=67825 RepID=UPI001E2A698B|nr:ESPR-type extended signal peptide-containing protein [Citrobacter rodentium]